MIFSVGYQWWIDVERCSCPYMQHKLPASLWLLVHSIDYCVGYQFLMALASNVFWDTPVLIGRALQPPLTQQSRVHETSVLIWEPSVSPCSANEETNSLQPTPCIWHDHEGKNCKYGSWIPASIADVGKFFKFHHWESAMFIMEAHNSLSGGRETAYHLSILTDQ